MRKLGFDPQATGFCAKYFRKLYKLFYRLIHTPIETRIAQIASLKISYVGTFSSFPNTNNIFLCVLSKKANQNGT